MAFQRAFKENPLRGSEDFLTKLEHQLNGKPDQLAQLAAEMLWVLFLFPRKLILSSRKRELVTSVWALSGVQFPTYRPYLSDEVLAGIGSAGTAFNTQRDRELEALIDITIELKGRKSVLNEPWSLAHTIDRLSQASRRNIRNILLHLLHPAEFERIASLSHKREIVNAFSFKSGGLRHGPGTPGAELDMKLLEIRTHLEEASEKDIDFYDPDLLAVWQPKNPRSSTRNESAPAKNPAPSPEKGDSGTSDFGHWGKDLNEYAWAGVWEANRLSDVAGIGEPGPDLLFAAYLLLGGHPTLGSRSAMVLDRYLTQTLGSRRPSADPSVDFILQRYGLPARPVFDNLPKTSPRAKIQRILLNAEWVRSTVGRGKAYPISTRHVLAALLRPGPDSVLDLLEQHDIDAQELRTVIYSSIALKIDQEDQGAWQYVLVLAEPSPYAESTPIYAGFSSDALASSLDSGVTREDDRLNVISDVTALCEVLAAHDTRPPLAVGLFGDWGTGKSFFMELMKNEIELLGQQNASFYCSRVVQVWFNAWHYMDTNLWASLASRVFEALAEQLEKWNEPEDLRQNLFEKLQESRGMLAEAVEQKADARARLEAIQSERAEKRKDVSETARIAYNAAISALAADKDVQQKLRYAKEQLGLSEADVQLETAADQARELSSLSTRLTAIGRALAREPRFLVLGLLVFGAVVGGTALALAQWELASTAARIITKIAAVIGGLCLALAPVVRKTSRAVRWLEEVSMRLNEQLEAERRREDLAIQRDILRLDEREREAQAQVDALARDIAEMQAGRRLERFITERHASGEYRGQLGIVSLIRNDFQQLSNLLSDARRERLANPVESEPSTKPLPRIDRIVLYIDDLDRCPEDRVVEVLQAVHLLLAFPLFVVVVGVDSRWLLLSLQDHYAALRGRSGEGWEERNTAESEWNTTPQNYLEKIFQIPFTLRPMESTGFGSLVEALLPLADRQQSTSVEEPTHDVGDHQADYLNSELQNQVEIDDGIDDERVDRATPNAAATPVLLNPQGLTVERWEREFIQALHPLIASPRALKRFTNIYRFIRVQQRGADLDRFRGTEADPGDFQVLALLLAALVGYPTETTDLLRQIARTPGASLWDLVEAVEEQAPNPALPSVPAGRQVRPTLQQALLEVKRTVPVSAHPPGSFARWGREVARFSFQSGHILSIR